MMDNTVVPDHSKNDTGPTGIENISDILYRLNPNYENETFVHKPVPDHAPHLEPNAESIARDKLRDEAERKRKQREKEKRGFRQRMVADAGRDDRVHDDRSKFSGPTLDDIVRRQEQFTPSRRRWNDNGGWNNDNRRWNRGRGWSSGRGWNNDNRQYRGRGGWRGNGRRNIVTRGGGWNNQGYQDERWDNQEEDQYGDEYGDEYGQQDAGPQEPQSMYNHLLGRGPQEEQGEEQGEEYGDEYGEEDDGGNIFEQPNYQ